MSFDFKGGGNKKNSNSEGPFTDNSNHNSKGSPESSKALACTKWAPTSYKWSSNPYNKWPYKWVTWVITPINGVITPLITGRGPSYTVTQVNL